MTTVPSQKASRESRRARRCIMAASIPHVVLRRAGATEGGVKMPLKDLTWDTLMQRAIKRVLGGAKVDKMTDAAGIEIVEEDENQTSAFTRIAEGAADWDGVTDPIRPLFT